MTGIVGAARGVQAGLTATVTATATFSLSGQEAHSVVLGGNGILRPPAWGIIRGEMEDIFGPSVEAPEYYIDSVRMALGLYTVTLELGNVQVQDTPSSEPPPIKRVAMVRMSPQHALILSRILQKNVVLYQSQFGKINIPPEVFKSMDLEPE